MLKRVVFFVVLAAFVVALASFNTAAAGPKADKVLICHCDPDAAEEIEPRGPFVIEVAASAVPGHLTHGDYVVDPASGLQVGDPCPWP